MSPTSYQQLKTRNRQMRRDHHGRTSRGLSVELARCFYENPLFGDDPAELLSDLKQCAAACIGAGCEPRVRPLPGHGQGVSLAAPAEADQVEDTLTHTLEPFSSFRYYLTVQRDSFEGLPSMTGKVLAIDCALHELDLFMQFKHGAGK